MKILYQIGDFPIFNHAIGVNGDAVGMTNSRDWRVAVATLTEVAGEYISGSYSNPLASPNKLTIKGGFDSSGGMSQDQKVNRLMFYAGRTNLPFIAFDYQACDCDGEGTCGHTPTISWFVAYGILLSVDRDTTYIEKQDANPLETFKFNLDIKLEVAWRRLSPYVWEYRRGGAVVDPFDDNCIVQGGANASRFPHPPKLDTLDNKGFFYRWGDDLIRYDPEFWSVKYTDGVSGGQGSGYVKPPYTAKILPDPGFWNGPPTALYALSQLSQSGLAHLRITYPVGLGNGMTETDDSYVDLATIHADLIDLGYNGLREDDVMIVGSVIPYPAFILRDDEIIPDYVPNWTYVRHYPGQVFSGPNKIELFTEGAEARMAYLIEYGIY